MKNITLALDEDIYRAGREYARQHHTSLNALVRRLLALAVQPANGAIGLEDFLRQASGAGGDSRGARWTREELHRA